MEVRSKTAACEILDRYVKLAQAHNNPAALFVRAEYPIPNGWSDDMLETNDERLDDEESFDKTDAAIRREINALADLLMRKNRDYGNAAASESPLCPELDSSTAILVRMGDTIKRLENLAAVKEARVDESFEDTVRDLAGYCVLYLACKSARRQFQGD